MAGSAPLSTHDQLHDWGANGGRPHTQWHYHVRETSGGIRIFSLATEGTPIRNGACSCSCPPAHHFGPLISRRRTIRSVEQLNLSAFDSASILPGSEAGSFASFAVDDARARLPAVDPQFGEGLANTQQIPTPSAASAQRLRTASSLHF